MSIISFKKSIFSLKRDIWQNTLNSLTEFRKIYLKYLDIGKINIILENRKFIHINSVYEILPSVCEVDVKTWDFNQ